MTASDMGRKGGEATLKKLGKAHYKKIAEMSHAKRKKAVK